MRERVAIVLPLFNEARTVGRVLRAVRRFAPRGCAILVVNDGSTDRSAAVLAAEPDLQVVTHERNLGYGASLISGFGQALARGYEVVVTLDCDEQHEPHQIPALLGALAGADIVSGSRYLPGSDRGQDAPLDRLRINREITRLVNELTGLDLTDAFCGFKAYRAAVLGRIELDEPCYGLPLQIWIQAARLGLRVREIPTGRIYKCHDRRFAGSLDDPCLRRRYYLDILHQALRRWPLAAASSVRL